ncbi:MAG: DNA repair protein RadC [Rickettsiales bacterium]|jgi:DNA repair protein RadC|nr:DNA repair protein RadC [Rickettsiales bacterium]
MSNKNKSKDKNNRREEIEFRALESNGRALLDREIIETFLSVVYDSDQALAIAKNLVDTCQGIGRILSHETDDLKTIEGMTDSAVAIILCIKETLERVLREKLKDVPVIDDLEKLVEYLKVSIGHADKECVKILYLDKKHHLIGEEMYIGTVDSAPVYIKGIARKALIKNAASIIISHNHPGGRAEPSDEDKAATKGLALACSTVDIKLLDHIIITSADYFSFREKGLL